MDDISLVLTAKNENTIMTVLLYEDKIVHIFHLLVYLFMDNWHVDKLKSYVSDGWQTWD